MSEAVVTVTRKLHFTHQRRGRRAIQPGPKPMPPATGRTPRVARLMALAIRFDGLIRSGVIALCMDAFPPDRRARDLDNLQKGLLDSMQHAGVYQNDSQIDLLFARRGPVAHGGYVRVQVQSLPLVICPVCGRYDPPQVEAN